MYLTAGILLFIGSALILAYFSKLFSGKTFQLVFFVLSMLMVLGGFALILSSHNIQYNSVYTYSGSSIANISSSYNSSSVSGIFSSMYSSTMYLVMFMICVIIIFMIYDAFKINMKGGKEDVIQE